MEEKKNVSAETKDVAEVKETNKKERAKVKPEETNPIIVLTKSNEEVPLFETVEKEREGLFSLYKKTSRMSTFMMIAVVIIFVVAFICLGQPGWGQYVCWTLVGATVVGMIVYFIFTKNLYPNASKKYFSTFWEVSNNYLFNSPEFTDCQIDTKERYVLPDIICEKIYKDVIDSASRNIVKGKYKGKGFVFGELAFYRAGAKRGSKDVVFVGRHLSVTNDYHFEGRYIVNIRGEKEIDLPTDIDDLKELEKNNKFIIYGPENGNPQKDLGKDLLNNLKSIECTGSFLNANFVFWAGHTAAYLSYDDQIVAIPFDKPLDMPAYMSLRKNIKDVFEILESK